MSNDKTFSIFPKMPSGPTRGDAGNNGGLPNKSAPSRRMERLTLEEVTLKVGYAAVTVTASLSFCSIMGSGTAPS